MQLVRILYTEDQQLIVDFGTATTFDVIGPDGTFEAGVIAPGIRTSAQSLWGEADMLPAIEIRKPKSILAKEINYGNAGRSCIRTNRSDGIYYQTNERRIRIIRMRK